MWIPFLCVIFTVVLIAALIKLLQIDHREGPEEDGPWGGGGGGWDGDPRKPLPTGGGWDVPDFFPFEWIEVGKPRVIPAKEKEEEA